MCAVVCNLHSGFFGVLKSEHVAPPRDSPSRHIHPGTQKWDICKDFEPSLFTSAHFPAYFCLWQEAEVSGEMQLPLGINKCANHTSPEDTCKHLYLWDAVGIFTKHCWDKETIPGSTVSITIKEKHRPCLPLFLLLN